MKKSIKTLALSLAALGLLSGCTIGGKTSSSASSASGSESSSASQSSSSSSSSQVPETLDDTLELLVQKAALKQAKLTIPEYKESEFLGPNLIVDTFIGEYAEYGKAYYFTTEAGLFAYSVVDGSGEYEQAILNPELSLYDAVSTPYNIVNEDIADVVTEVEENENSWLVDFDLSSNTLKGYFASLIGYNSSNYSKVSAASALIEKDASEILFTVTYNGTEEQAALESIGTYDNAEARAFVAALPPYEAPGWPAEELAAVFEEEGLTPFEIPALEAEGYAYDYSDDYVDYYGVFMIYVTGPTSADLPAYQAAFEAAGWTVEYDSSEDEYSATKTFEDGIARVIFYYYNGYVGIQVYLAKDPLPVATWPADDVAAYLGNEITDVVPAYSGEATGYQFFEDYGAVIVSVEADTEDAGVIAYQADLVAAGYAFLKKDSYGDNHYVSENLQIDVCVYAGEPGQVIIQFKASSAVAGFPAAQLNAFFEAKEFGFELDPEAFAGLTPTLFEITTGGSASYPWIQVTMSGDQVAALDAIIGPLAVAAGYEKDQDTAASIHYENSAYDEVYIQYSSTSDTTILKFWK